MKKHTIALKVLVILLLVSGIAAGDAVAQNVVAAPKARVSPLGMAAKKLENGTYVKITYGQPQRNDPKSGEPREVFGKLVPFDQVWRLGANEATEIITTGDIEIAGKRLPAGAYSLFAIPKQGNTWTLIVNKDIGIWGTSYNEANDVFRVDVPVTTTDEINDAFSVNFDKEGANLDMKWEKARVTVPVKAL